jgi:hypothetical protein
MKRWRVVCFHVRSSGGGSPYLSRIRTVSVGPRSAGFDYVLTHVGFMGYHKLSNVDGRCNNLCYNFPNYPPA